MPKLIAKTELRYGYDVRNIKAGEEFDATDEDARVLIAVGKAQAAPDVAELPHPGRRRDDPVEAPPAAPAVEAAAMTTEDAPFAPSRRRGYGRRDMRAEK